jgi:hypothetical protein
MALKQRKAVEVLACAILFFMAAASLMKAGTSAKGSGMGKEQLEQGWRVGQPVTYQNLTIFPVLSASNLDTSEFATLDDALASGDALVTEQGNYLRRNRDGVASPAVVTSNGAQVNQLVLVNRGKRPLLLLAGEVVSGGKQDRIIGKDRLVPVGAAPLPLDVFCVEHGRWTGGSDKFVAGNTMVHPSVREKAAVEQDQSQVWEAVRAPGAAGGVGAAGGALNGAISARADAPAPMISAETVTTEIESAAHTQSYRKIYQSSRVGNSVEEFTAEMERRFERASRDLKGERVVGVVVAYGDEVVWSDDFASSELFETYWPKLLRSYVVEALTRPATIERASLEDAQDFLHFRSVAMRNSDNPAFEKTGVHVNEESEPGVYVWREQSEGRKTEIRIEALMPKQITLHWMKVATQ